MDIFPVQYSTLASAALKDVIAAWYGLEGVRCRLLIRNVSDTYLIETPQHKFIFKIYRDAHRKLEEIKGEVQLLNYLKAGGASVAYPIADKQGQQIQSFNAPEGFRYGVLFYFAPGEAVYDMNDQQLRLLGSEMAKVHQLSAEVKLDHTRKPYNYQTMLYGPLDLLKPVFGGLDQEYQYLVNTAADVVSSLEKLPLDQFSYGYCHYDYLPKNFHFEGDDKLTFFDFDFAGQGYLANDIASLYIHYFLEVTAGKSTREQTDKSFNIFVEAYRQLRPLSDHELAAIPYLGFAFWVFYLGFQYENFDDWSSIFFNKAFVKNRVALIKKWMDFFNNDTVNS